MKERKMRTEQNLFLGFFYTDKEQISDGEMEGKIGE